MLKTAYKTQEVKYEEWMIARPAQYAGLDQLQALAVGKYVEAKFDGQHDFSALAEDATSAIKSINQDAARRFSRLIEHKLAGYNGRISQPVLIFVGGTSGSGKDTLVNDLQALTDIDRVQSTDMLRKLARDDLEARYGGRDNIPPEFEPVFEASFKADVGDYSVTEGFKIQAKAVCERIPSLVEEALDESSRCFHPFYLYYGGHILPGYDQNFEEAKYTHTVLLAPQEDVMLERRLVRAEMEEGPQTEGNVLGRTDVFGRIYAIQEHLVVMAGEHSTPVLDSPTRDGMVTQFADSLTETLERVLRDNDVELREI